MKNLYLKDDLKLMRAAEDSLLMGQNRVNELMAFAKNSGIKKIGIAHCIGMTREAEELKMRLQNNQFEVHTVNCKYGKVPATEILEDENARGTSCNPAGQAQYLADNNTELNISFGLCMGHDMMFNMKSKVPTTTLIVKDREHKHNTYNEFKK